MAKITLNERARVGLTYRLAGVNQPDIPTRRKVDRVWDALKLDELSADALAKGNLAGAVWAGSDVTYEITSEMRDYLIEWLTPTERHPMNGFQGRILGPIYDELKEARDGKTVEEEAP
jgi:hypothetical protein